MCDVILRLDARVIDKSLKYLYSVALIIIYCDGKKIGREGNMLLREIVITIEGTLLLVGIDILAFMQSRFTHTEFLLLC